MGYSDSQQPFCSLTTWPLAWCSGPNDTQHFAQWKLTTFIFTLHFHSMNFCDSTDSSSLTHPWLNSATFPQEEKGSVWLQTTFRWWQLTIELISTFTQWISVNQLTTCLSFDSRTWRPMYPEILESILSFYQKSKIFQESNMVRPVFLAGWDLHFLMELPFGWIWQ